MHFKATESSGGSPPCVCWKTNQWWREWTGWAALKEYRKEEYAERRMVKRWTIKGWLTIQRDNLEGRKTRRCKTEWGLQRQKSSFRTFLNKSCINCMFYQKFALFCSKETVVSGNDYFGNDNRKDRIWIFVGQKNSLSSQDRQKGPRQRSVYSGNGTSPYRKDITRGRYTRTNRFSISLSPGKPKAICVRTTGLR